MGQAEAIKLLQKKKTWMSAEDIANGLRVENRKLIRRALRKLYDYNEVLRKRCKSSAHFKYVYKAIKQTK